MHDGTVIQTWGVQVSETGQWVGKVHPVGLTQANRAEAHANGALFAASKSMAALLTEAVEAYAGQFDATENQDISISGADFIDWFTQWRLRVRAALRVAGTLDMATITPNRRADIEALIARGRSKPHTSNKET